MAVEVQSLKRGETQTFEAHGRKFAVKRLLVAHDVYHLRDMAITERSRFGTREQIAEDVQYVETCGVLPPRSAPRW